MPVRVAPWSTRLCHTLSPRAASYLLNIYGVKFRGGEGEEQTITMKLAAQLLQSNTAVKHVRE